MQFVLAPIYLLGAFASGARPGAGWIVPFLAVHVGLYGGATAFNSYYDRDTGPISFRKRPRPVTRSEMRAALVLQLVALAFIFATTTLGGLIATAMFFAGIAYSHPRWRWKRSAVGSLTAVALGQGSGAFYLGYLASGGTAGAGGSIALAAVGTAVTTMGLYPITQVYQIEEDQSRGDQTVAVRFGWRKALVWSVIAATAGSCVLALALAEQLGPGWTASLIAAPLMMGALITVWTARFETQTVERRHDWAMGISALASVFFLALACLGLGR